MSANSESKHEEMELRRGPWTLEEDSLLIHYIACHGEGRWNLLARCSGLKRTGKSCRLRWLNYLKPDVKRGNLSPEEQLLILDLHSKWGNRWSRIAQHLPGRTDNEIKNYWRTRVQKQARQLNIDVNSTMFRDALRCYWMPRLLEKVGSSQFIHSLYPNISTTAPPAAPPPPLPVSVVPIMESSYHSSRYYQLSSSNSSSPSVSQLPELTKLPWSSPDELDGPTSNQFLHDQFINNDYNLGEWDLGSASSNSASDCGVVGNNCIDSIPPDGLWSMIEAYMSGFDGDNQN